MSNPVRQSPRFPEYDYALTGAYLVTTCSENRKSLFGVVNDDSMVLSEIGKMVEQYWLEIPARFPNVTLDIFVIMPDHLHGIIFLHQNLDEEIRIANQKRESRGGLVSPPSLEKTGKSTNQDFSTQKNTHTGGLVSPPSLEKTGKHTNQDFSTQKNTQTGGLVSPPSLEKTGKSTNQDFSTQKNTHTGGLTSPPLLNLKKDTSLPQVIQWFKSKTTYRYQQFIKNDKEIVRTNQDNDTESHIRLWQRSYADRIIRNEYELNQKRKYILENPLRWSLKNSGKM